MKIGLALGGGGARGLYHIGVLKALEKLKLKINCIAGTSMGSIIGGLYALYADGDKVENIISRTLQKHRKVIDSFKIFSAPTSVESKKLFLEKSFEFVKNAYLWNLRIVKPYLVSPRPFFKILKDLFSDRTFSDCKISFIATAVEINTAKLVLLKSGYLWRAIAASSALSGFFAPVKLKGRALVDGGTLVPLPAEVLKDECDFIIGVSVEVSSVDPPFTNNAIDIMFTVDQIRYKWIADRAMEEADFNIAPHIEGMDWPDFEKGWELVKRGEVETLARSDELFKAIKRAKLRKYFFFK